MKPSPPVGCTRHQLLERRYHRLVTALNQQLLRGIAPPAIWMRQRCYELRRGRTSQRGLRSARIRTGAVDHAPDPSVADGQQQVVLADVVSEVLAPDSAGLHYTAVHVDDVHGAVGRGVARDRAATLVGRREELTLRPGVLHAQPPAAIVNDLHLMDKIGWRIGNENV